MLLTDELLLHYKRCQRRVFLDMHGQQRRDPAREFLLKLRQESQKHVKNIIAQSYSNYHRPQGTDWQEKARNTEALMQQGAEFIYQGVLLQTATQLRPLLIPSKGIPETSLEDITLAGTPTLLVKQPGKSKFGDWQYLLINIQFGRRPKPEYKIIASFHAQLLAAIEGVPPRTPKLILRRQDKYFVNLTVWLPQVREALAGCIEMLLKQEEPEVFISRQRCNLCHWYSSCYEIAAAQNHLSLVPGVTPSRYQHLQDLGVKTVESLATASTIYTGDLIGFEVASELKQQALALVENRPIVKSNRVWQNFNIATAPIELYFDIEAEPERNLDYLLGILLVDRQTGTEQFYPFIAEKPEDEATVWQQFLAFVLQYETATIYHYSDYEAETIKRLALLYQTSTQQTQQILSRLVDLHNVVMKSVTLPVKSYSLKSLAHWLGFQWRDREASGEQAVCWYDRWLREGDRASLEAVLRYNEDDCRATRHLKDWLVLFLIQSSLQPLSLDRSM